MVSETTIKLKVNRTNHHDVPQSRPISAMDKVQSGAFLIIFWAFWGCYPAFSANQETGTYREDEVRVLLTSELRDFERYIEMSMKEAQTILRRRKVKDEDLEKLQIWQDAQLARFHQALQQEDSFLALIDAWAISKSLANYFDQGTVREELPDNVREVALDMLKQREDRLVYLASKYLQKDSLTLLSKQIEAFSLNQSIPQNEILQTDSQKRTVPRFSVWAKGQTAVGGLLQIPLMPGRALKGVSESGKALSGIRESTSDAVKAANELPERIRVQFQLALNDLLERREEVLEILGTMDTVSNNLRATAEASQLTAAEVEQAMVLSRELLPAGESLAVAVEGAVKASTELVRAISEQSISSPDTPKGAKAGERGGFNIKEYETAGIALSGAANEIRLMLAEIRMLMEESPDKEKEKDKKPFDVRQYGAAAESIQHGAAEIRGILSDLSEMVDDENLRNRAAVFWQEADTSADRTVEKTKEVFNHLTWRLILTAVIVFFLACLYTYFRIWLNRI